MLPCSKTKKEIGNLWFRLMNGDIEVHYNILYCLHCNMFVWTLIENIQ